jgi:hypothetical protein
VYSIYQQGKCLLRYSLRLARTHGLLKFDLSCIFLLSMLRVVPGEVSELKGALVPKHSERLFGIGLALELRRLQP